MDLDRALRRVGGDHERVGGLLERETVGDERLEVDEAAGDEADGLGVLVAVAVLELAGRQRVYRRKEGTRDLQVDLVGGAVAEGVLV